MKQIRKYMLAALSLAVAVSANAGVTFPASGTFDGGVIDTDQTVNLASTQSEPLVITGTVTVKAGATLTIRPNNDKRSIQFGSNGRFVIEQGATLIIGSTDAITKISDIEARIITLDAGAQFTRDDTKKESVSVGTGTDYRINNKDYLTTSQSARSNALIDNQGTLYLKGVRIHDYYGSVEQASAILHSGGSGTTTTLYHCKISECKATVGSAILACRGSNGSLFIEDTEIDNIISTEENEGNHGAAVRSWGNSLVHMTLTNVRIHHCFAVADAAAIYWPACSENSDGQLATLTLDGCEIDCNYSSKKVGAVDVCGSFKLGETKVTRIHHNYSGGDAGGISFRPYNSGAQTSQTGLNITYDLTDKLEIYDNIANGDGGGLAVIASNTSLPGKPTFTLEVNGTKIYNNVTRTGKGGGMYLYKLAGATDAGGNAYKYYLTLIKGEIYNNKSGLKADGTYNAADGGGIYLDGLTINSEVENTVKIHNNVAGKDGGGFYIKNATYTMESGELYSNTANSGNGGGLYISGTGGNLTMNEGKIYGNSTKVGNGGGIYMNNGNITLNEGEVYENYTEVGNGGGIYVYNGVLSFGTASTETELYGNTSAMSGGAIYVKSSSGDIVLNNVKLGKASNSNTATDGNGGAIYVEAMASGKKMSITNCDIRNNKAFDGVSSSEDGKGGAFYVKSGNVEITDGTITGNESQLDGGSFFSAGGNLTISGAKITGNKSTGRNGGAFYLASGNITLTDNAVVSGNEAKLAGGAIYIENGNASLLGNSALSDNDADTDGGAIYLAKGNVTLDGNAVLSGNEAKNNGGAIYMATGTFTVTNGLLSTNKAQNGAGAYINGGTVNYNSGTIDGNTASANGGGLYVTGGTVTFNDGSITGNTAKNGAGLYLASGAKMTFKGGTIYSNNAVASTDKTLSKTAYNGGDGSPVEGCGGGVYLQSGSATKKTTLTFDLKDNSVQKYRSFGLYSNTAASAGADIVSEGYNTSVLLPDVSQMNLVGFEGQEANPNWYEDFFKKDPNYGKGYASDMYTGGEYDIDRMNVLRDESDLRYKNHLIKSTGFDAIKEKYLCLTLSYEYINLTITATGIIGRESILIDLIRHTMSGNNVKYSIVLPGDGTTGVASRTVFNVPWGTYSIIPRNDWNWAYEPIDAMNNVRIGDKMEHEFIFNMNHKDNSEVPLHDEKNSAKRAGAGSEEEPALIQ